MEEGPRPRGLIKKREAAPELLKWYRKHGRDFIWREEGFSSYGSLIAEMMLQKTQAKVVEPVLKEFLARYPTVESIHRAPRKEIEKLIKRLGLFRTRSKNMKKVAKIIVEKYGGKVGASMDELAELPGVGPYVSSAVRCFKGEERVPVLDANVARVVGRLYGIDYRDPKHQKELWGKAEGLLPRKNVKEFNWALIDLGALVCKPSNPKCGECPLRSICHVGRDKIALVQSSPTMRKGKRIEFETCTDVV